MSSQFRPPAANRLRRRTAVLTAGLLAIGLGACSGGGTPTPGPTPARADAVALRADAPDGLSIGVVISLTSAPGEGAEWRDAAEGARVATRRFELGGTDVRLIGANDKGTERGAASAVRTLVDRGVAGIVLATSGDHVRGGLNEAAAAGVPVVLPYTEDAAHLPPGAWVTGPEAPVAAGRLVQALRARGARRPFLVDAGGGPLEALVPSGTATLRTDADPAALAAKLKRRQRRDDTSFDAVVVSGPATRQATVVQALQGAGIDVPFFLTPDALSPAFAAALRKADGSLSAEFVSVGLDAGDAAALEPSAAGRALAAYFSALRMTAAEPALQDLLGERPFAEVAGAADVRSHDAVVALVRAAEAAGRTAPAEVSSRLSGLRLTRGDGLAGPALSFTSPGAVAADDMVALGATPTSPGVRPEPGRGSSSLFWFPMPAS